MKTIFSSLALLVFFAFSFTPSMVRAQDGPGDQGVSFQVFYDQLGDQGTWIQTDDYGYVFQPNVEDPNWAPYTEGHWVSTDEGWTWVSDESWGWATYHYGRWANIEGTGWVWVPGYRWAPAWVSWRSGGDYYGWAPLPPETLVGDRFGDGVDVSFHIGPGCYNFLRVEDMGDPDYRGRFVNRSSNYVIINNTTNITNITVNNRTANSFQGVNAGGPQLSEVNAHSRQHVQTAKLTQAKQAGKNTLQGNSLAVYAPRVNPTTVKQAKPAKVAQTLNHAAFNRGDSIAKPLDVTSKVKAPAPTPQAIQAARQAAAKTPAGAKVPVEKPQANTTEGKPPVVKAPVAPVLQEKAPVLPGAVPPKPVAVKPEAAQPNAPHRPASVPPAADKPAEQGMTLRPAEANPQAANKPPVTQQEVRPLRPAQEQQAPPHLQQPVQPEAHPQQEAPHPQPAAQQEARPQRQPQEAHPQDPAGNNTNSVPIR